MNQTVNGSKKFYDIEKDGITQGLLYQFMECRQKARWFLTGLSPREPGFALIFGSVGHGVLERVYGEMQSGKLKGIPTEDYVRSHVQVVEKTWRKDNPKSSERALQDLELSCLFADAVMPAYFAYWHKDLVALKWLQVESQFSLPYTLEDGRKTVLRGKFDGFFQKKGKLWLNENKTKSRIEEDNLVDYLPFELQVNLYLHALRRLQKEIPFGVLYNIIRRPQLKQGKNETLEQFANRVRADVKERPEWYFINYEIHISSKEMDKWDGELEDLLKDFYDWWEGKSGHYRNTAMCENKYGRCGMLDACCGRLNRYAKRPTVYRELEDM